MALNCLVAVVLGLLLLLPRRWRTGHTLPQLRAGEELQGGGELAPPQGAFIERFVH